MRSTSEAIPMARPRFRARAKNALEQIPLARRRFKVRSFKKMSAAPQRERFDHAKLRRGSRKRFENRKKPRVFEGRPAESPQRVARAI